MPIFRKAEARDLRAVVDLLTADAVAGPRDVAFATYEKMFAEMLADKNQLLAVAELDKAIIGCLQITIIPGLSRGATRRGQIEGMRINSAARGKGHGSAF